MPRLAVNRGPVTEITADTRRESRHAYRGVGGIMCTTEFTAEVTQSDEMRDSAVENAAYHQYQWSILH